MPCWLRQLTAEEMHLHPQPRARLVKQEASLVGLDMEVFGLRLMMHVLVRIHAV